MRVDVREARSGVLRDLIFDAGNLGLRYVAVAARNGGGGIVPAALALPDARGGLRLSPDVLAAYVGSDEDETAELFGGRALCGFRVEALAQGTVGAVEDVLVDDDWSLAGLLVAPHGWSSVQRFVELPVEAIERVDRVARAVHVRAMYRHQGAGIAWRQ